MTQSLIRLFVVLFLCLARPAGLMAQLPATLRFDNIGITEGLSQSTINEIVQDRQGYIWISTEDGVNRYDGYQFRIFRYEENNMHSLPNSRVYAMHEDQEGNLWFVCMNGIGVYRPSTNTFDRIAYPQPTVSFRHTPRIMETAHELLVGEDRALYRINKQTRRLSQTDLLLPGDDPYVLCKYNETTLLFTRNSQELYTYDLATRKSHPYPLPCSLDHIGGIKRIAPARLLVFGRHSFVIYDTLRKTCAPYMSFKDFELYRSAVFDNNGLLWMGTNEGLLRIDTQTTQYTLFRNVPSDPLSLAGNTIRCILKDRSGILWIGTNEGGISRLVFNKFKFTSISRLGGNVPGYMDKGVLSFAEDDQDNMWMGSEVGSINICNSTMQQITRLHASSGCDLGANYILGLIIRNGTLYYGHDDGVGMISVQTRQRTGDALVQRDCYIHKFYNDSRGRLWACAGPNLYKLDPARNKFERYPLPFPTKYLDDLIEDDQHNLWLGMTPGLVKFNTETGKFTDYGAKFPQLIALSGSVAAFSKDRQGKIWMGVNERGLLEYLADKDSFRVHGTAEGLPDLVVYASACDTFNRVWLSTNAGISCFDPQKNTFTNYHMSDGLQSNEFNGRAVYKDHKARLWFGGVNGCSIIDPAHIYINKAPPHPQITSFKVFEKERDYYDALVHHQPLRIREADNYFTIEYSAMDYTNAAENKYRIKLEGFDQDWRPLSKAHTVSYTNLDAGHYTFKVIAYNNDGIPAEHVLELPIYIVPPFWKTGWFYTLMVLVIVASAYSFYRYRINELKKEIRLRTTIASDLHDDVGATLSSIKMLSAILEPKIGAEHTEARGLVSTISSRAATTLEAMSDIVWSINPKNDELENVVLRMKTYTAELLDDTDIDYRFRIAPELGHLKLNQQQRKETYLIFKEALNNILKYAAADKIEISLVRNAHHFTLQLQDNGKGFDPQQTTASLSGNGLKNMHQRAAAIGAVLDIQSSPGQGTLVALRVPIP